MKRQKIKKRKIEVNPNQITPISKGTMALCVHALCSNYATWSIKPGSVGRLTFCDFHKDYWVSVKRFPPDETLGKTA